MRTVLFKGDYPVTSSLGSNYGGPNKGRPTHAGVDWGLPEGTELYAFEDGILYHNTNDTAGNGYKLVGQYKSFYSHLKTRLITNGSKVKRGQLIGYSGKTGRVTGPHLHFETLLVGRYQDPLSLVVINEEDDMSKIFYVKPSWNAPIRNDLKQDADRAIPGELYKVIEERTTFKAGDPVTNKEYKIGDNQWLHGADVEELTYDKYIEVLNTNHRAELTELSEHSAIVISELTDQVDLLKVELENAQKTINALKEDIKRLEAKPIEKSVQQFDIVRFILSLFKKS